MEQQWPGKVFAGVALNRADFASDEAYERVSQEVLAGMSAYSEILILRAEMEKQRRAVIDWVNEQSRNLQLVTNDRAPAWPDYETALEAYKKAVGLA